MKRIVLVGIGMLLLSGCGGTTFQSGGSGVGGTAGAGVGGAAGSTGGGGTAGSAGVGGTAGSTGVGGGTAGSAGAGGGAGICSQPSDPGPCEAYMPRYWFHAQTGVCERFIYGGCQGNGNNFATVDDCYAACAASVATDVTSCGSPPDCTVSSPACCGACDGADESLLVAVRANALDAYRQSLACGSVACSACPPPNPVTHTTPYFGATCRAGRCVLLDARTTALTACTLPGDCRLRNGLACCERCSESLDTLIAVNASVTLPGCLAAPPCPPCMPVYPPAYGATCSGGRCAVILR